MVNYNFLQKILHKLALSSSMMRENLFNIERSIFLEEVDNDGNHIFIVGLARSGTTILLNTLFSTNEFASLTYRDMPFIMSPNIWSKFNSNNLNEKYIDRYHNDGIKVSLNSPEAFEEVFWSTFPSKNPNFFEDYIKLILKKNNKSRYLSKNNQNISRLDFLANNFPDSLILVTFRDPLQHAQSLLNQHIKFSKKDNDAFISMYMSLIGHKEFGPNYTPVCLNEIKYTDDNEFNHWLEQYFLVYGNILETFKSYNNIKFVCYESLCENAEVLNVISNLSKIKFNIRPKLKSANKPITHKYDSNLSDKANNLYLQMKQISL